MARLPALLCCVVLTACSVFAQPIAQIDAEGFLPASSGEAVQTAYPAPFPARGGDVDWGLALSGGGLRSAAFSIGAMKALYDLELLDDIDVISSVSGGGYASFWLYSRYDENADERFGSAAFDSARFPTQVCTLAKQSRFFPFRQMLAAVVSPRGIAFRSYRRAIQRSFGSEATRDRPLNALMPQISDARVPYFILNTTLKSLPKRDGKKPTAIDKSFEIAPTYRGNRWLGYADWPDNNISIMSWADAVAVSGAAVRFKLSRKIPNYSSVLTTRHLDLADGGLSENLAALPLILRGVKNIVIVDAENDPAYKFESYCNLRKYLQDAGITLTVGKVDQFINCDTRRHRTNQDVFTSAAVAEGTAQSDPGYDGNRIRSKIYYIKMSRPVSIFSDSALKATGIDPENLKYEGRDRPGVCPPDALRPITRETMLRDVVSYARYLNSDWRWGKFIAFLPYINYNFPQIATIDQTFYTNQLDAFIGLGYLEGCGMENLVATRSSCGNKSRL